MFISALELFTVGIGPSSSHTIGPMVAAQAFAGLVRAYGGAGNRPPQARIRCVLKGSLAYTGKGHATDRAVALGLHGYSPKDLAARDVEQLLEALWRRQEIVLGPGWTLRFWPEEDIIFDLGSSLREHPNGMIFELIGDGGEILLEETYFSIGGGFISTLAEIKEIVAPLKMVSGLSCPYPFHSARVMLEMAHESGLTIAAMKRLNEREDLSDEVLNKGLDSIWEAMRRCVERGLEAQGTLPGGLLLTRRARSLHIQLKRCPEEATLNDWMCAYAMAVGEENAAGHMVVTAPTNGAAGVIAAVLYYFVVHKGGRREDVREFLLTASAIGGLIKHRSSVSGAEVGCQGEIGSAASMAAAGLCAVLGGSAEQIENGAEIALEHHLGMTCDPVQGLVQVPCIERNGFGAVKAYTAASLAMRGSGQHIMPFDACIAAMKQTGMEMSHKLKETSLGGLAVSISEC